MGLPSEAEDVDNGNLLLSVFQCRQPMRSYYPTNSKKSYYDKFVPSAAEADLEDGAVEKEVPSSCLAHRSNCTSAASSSSYQHQVRGAETVKCSFHRCNRGLARDADHRRTCDGLVAHLPLMREGNRLACQFHRFIHDGMALPIPRFPKNNSKPQFKPHWLERITVEAFEQARAQPKQLRDLHEQLRHLRVPVKVNYDKLNPDDLENYPSLWACVLAGRLAIGHASFTLGKSNDCFDHFFIVSCDIVRVVEHLPNPLPFGIRYAIVATTFLLAMCPHQNQRRLGDRFNSDVIRQAEQCFRCYEDRKRDVGDHELNQVCQWDIELTRFHKLEYNTAEELLPRMEADIALEILGDFGGSASFDLTADAQILGTIQVGAAEDLMERYAFILNKGCESYLRKAKSNGWALFSKSEWHLLRRFLENLLKRTDSHTDKSDGTHHASLKRAHPGHCGAECRLIDMDLHADQLQGVVRTWRNSTLLLGFMHLCDYLFRMEHIEEAVVLFYFKLLHNLGPSSHGFTDRDTHCDYVSNGRFELTKFGIQRYGLSIAGPRYEPISLDVLTEDFTTQEEVIDFIFRYHPGTLDMCPHRGRHSMWVLSLLHMKALRFQSNLEKLAKHSLSPSSFEECRERMKRVLEHRELKESEQQAVKIMRICDAQFQDPDVGEGNQIVQGSSASAPIRFAGDIDALERHAVETRECGQAARYFSERIADAARRINQYELAVLLDLKAGVDKNWKQKLTNLINPSVESMCQERNDWSGEWGIWREKIRNDWFHGSVEQKRQLAHKLRVIRWTTEDLARKGVFCPEKRLVLEDRVIYLPQALLCSELVILEAVFFVEQSFVQVSNVLVLEWRPSAENDWQPISEIPGLQGNVLDELLCQAEAQIRQGRPLKGMKRLWSFLRMLASPAGSVLEHVNLQALDMLIRLEKVLASEAAKVLAVSTRAYVAYLVCSSPEAKLLQKQLSQHCHELVRSMGSIWMTNMTQRQREAFEHSRQMLQRMPDAGCRETWHSVYHELHDLSNQLVPLALSSAHWNGDALHGPFADAKQLARSIPEHTRRRITWDSRKRPSCDSEASAMTFGLRDHTECSGSMNKLLGDVMRL